LSTKDLQIALFLISDSASVWFRKQSGDRPPPDYEAPHGHLYCTVTHELA